MSYRINKENCRTKHYSSTKNKIKNKLAPNSKNNDRILMYENRSLPSSISFHLHHLFLQFQHK